MRSGTPPDQIEGGFDPPGLMFLAADRSSDHHSYQHVQGQIEVGVRIELAQFASSLQQRSGVRPSRRDHSLAVQGQRGRILPVRQESSQHLDTGAVEAVVKVDKELLQVSARVV